MKSLVQRFNIVMFLIALVSFQSVSSLELNSIKFSREELSLKNFDDNCYYDLKVDLIIRNYVTKITTESQETMDRYSVTTDITFEFFWKAFKEGNYGKIAPELAESEDYVKSYWHFFTDNPSSTRMNEENFTNFMALYNLEGELLIMDIHPTLSQYFKNDNVISQETSCKITMAYWMMTGSLLQKIFTKFEWSIFDKSITTQEIFSIFTQTHTGKCWIMEHDDCEFFSPIISKIYGFFNMSNGSRTMNISEVKIAYSTFIFSDIHTPPCESVKFDDAIIADKVANMANMLPK
jgi:hypothetical protein